MTDRVKQFFNDGHILSSTEVNYTSNSNRGAIAGLGSGLGDGADYIIQGVNAVITPGVNVTYSDGYVFLNGEVLKVDAGTTPRTVGTDLYEFQKVTTNPAAGERLYGDGQTKFIYEQNRAVPTNVASITTLSVDGDTSLASTSKSGIISSSDKILIDSINRFKVLKSGSINNISMDNDLLNNLYSVSGNFLSAQLTFRNASLYEVTVTFDSNVEGLSVFFSPVIRINSNSVVGDDIHICYGYINTGTLNSIKIYFRRINTGATSDFNARISIVSDL